MQPLPINNSLPLSYQLPLSDSVMFLPYVDEVDARHVLMAKDLIKQEMAHLNKDKDYLKQLPLPMLPLIDSQKIQNEIKRVLVGDNMLKEEELENIKDDCNDINIWKSQIDKLKEAAQYYELKRVSQNLLKKHGCSTWEKNIKLIKDATDILKMKINEINQEKEKVNSIRFEMQFAYKEKELELTKRYNYQIQKNTMLQTEIAKYK